MSFCDLGDQMAGPFDVLSILNCKPLLSAIRGIIPPIASISFTKCPFAEPPIDGLHDNTPIVASDIVIRAVEQFIKAEALAASIPA